MVGTCGARNVQRHFQRSINKKCSMMHLFCIMLSLCTKMQKLQLPYIHAVDNRVDGTILLNMDVQLFGEHCTLGVYYIKTCLFTYCC